MGLRIEHEDMMTENHDINVTPFIDVMLVLLIIFMVAAPLATVDIEVDLPAASATPAKKPDKPLYLTVGADLSLSVGEMPVTKDNLVVELQRAAGEQKDPRIFLRADRTVDYGNLMATLDQLRASGYLKVALVAKEGGGSE